MSSWKQKLDEWIDFYKRKEDNTNTHDSDWHNC